MTAPVADRPALLRHLLAAEWIKLWSLRSTAWLLGLGALMVVGMSAVASVQTVQTWPTLDPLAQAQFEPLTDMLTLAVLALPIVAGCVGALSVVGEYATGMIRTTFIAVPGRIRVVVAKVTVLAGVLTAFGAVVSVGAFLVSQAILSGGGVDLSGDPDTVRAVVATALVLPVSGLAGMGIGAVARHTAVAVAAVCTLLVALPSLSKRDTLGIDSVLNWFPYQAWRRLVHLGDVSATAHLPSVADSWLVFGCWSVAGVVLAAIVVRCRDV